MISSYPKIHTLGHRDIKDIFDDPVVIQEKVDGSQLSFSFSEEKGLLIKTRRQFVQTDTPKMFQEAALIIPTLDLKPGWVYRGEYLQKRKHNMIAYDRLPPKHIILFDIEKNDGHWCDQEELILEADRLGLFYVPVMAMGICRAEDIEPMLDRPSILGGTLEGVVVKNSTKRMLGKYVQAKFREVGAKIRKGGGVVDKLDNIASMYRSETRWDKAVMRLREAGELGGVPEDISKILKEVNMDLDDEIRDEVRDLLFSTFYKEIKKNACHGVADWYKRKLLVGEN